MILLFPILITQTFNVIDLSLVDADADVAGLVNAVNTYVQRN